MGEEHMWSIYMEEGGGVPQHMGTYLMYEHSYDVSCIMETRGVVSWGRRRRLPGGA